MLIQRNAYLQKIRPFFNTDLVKVLTGLRRSGKSIMMRLIQQALKTDGVQPAQCIAINFENMAFDRYKTAEALHQYLSEKLAGITGKAYLFLDEIQEVSGWERCINSLRVAYDCDIYITGSNARLLSGELATYLAGRYVQFEIHPFSFQEFLAAYRQHHPDAPVASVFQRYVEVGGMPFLTNIIDNPEDCHQYLSDVCDSVLLKDIISRNSIRDVDALKRIIAYTFSTIGQPFSATSLSRFFKSEQRKISIDTILNYLRYCQDAYLFSKVCREDISGKKILTVNEKYYATDHGLRAVAYGGNQQDIQLVLENIVFMELLRRGYRITVGRNGGREIDFIARRQDTVRYFQVAYLLAGEDTIEREFGAYEGISDNHPKYVLSMDAFDMSRNGIIHMNICDFLLGDRWK